ncbi:Organic anion transporting polypeptide 58Dc [Carabus blaptoides fortunei]
MSAKILNINDMENEKKPMDILQDEKKHMLEREMSSLDDNLDDMPLTDETMCGFGCIRGPFLQRFANKKAYVFLYGFLGCIFSACYAYSTGTITTIEKRFKIPSRNTGIISVGYDISQLFTSLFLSYYAGRGHRPRWMAYGLYMIAMYCILTALPHFLYGSGEDALLLTTEYGATFNENSTLDILEKQKRQILCENKNSTQCELEDGNVAPQVILFIAQLISGVGGSLYYTLGVTYMDDNIKKSKTPALISFSYFLRMLGPAIGYSLASFCLNIYISPTLSPTITTKDPRWLGAWWLGWGLLSLFLIVFATLLALFPKTLPRAAARKAKLRSLSKDDKEEEEASASFKDMMSTFKRLMTNTILMINNLAAVFYFLGYMPYWIFMPKYIETQYRQSASFSNFVTGTVGLVFSAFGVLISGIVISKFRPSARFLASWNVLIGAISVLGIISYAYLGCAENDNQLPLLPSGELQSSFECNANCSCDYVKYSPVCSQDGRRTFISACHAGCKNEKILPNGGKVFTDCSCIIPSTSPLETILNTTQVDGLNTTSNSVSQGWLESSATPGSCPIDCTQKFYIFLAVVCLLKFSGATGRASNFLVSVRCVEERDKAVAMGFGLMIMSLFAFIPSPILFGVILDKTCMVWGKTCSGTGNCWLYNGEMLRYTMNFTAAAFVAIGTLFDAGVWYFVKDMKIFDDDIKLEDMDTN